LKNIFLFGFAVLHDANCRGRNFEGQIELGKSKEKETVANWLQRGQMHINRR
jgi:hypothetical protein